MPHNSVHTLILLYLILEEGAVIEYNIRSMRVQGNAKLLDSAIITRR